MLDLFNAIRAERFSSGYVLGIRERGVTFKAPNRSPLMVTRCDQAQAAPPQQWLITPDKHTNNEFKAFDESMVGVKGLVDSGLKKIPSFFIHEHLKTEKLTSSTKKLKVPVIDIVVDGASGNPDKRGEIIGKIRDACENWGVFQIVNHGIPVAVMEEMIKGVIAFHEQDDEIKKKYYTRDNSKRVIYNSNLITYTTSSATWKDTILCKMTPVEPKLG